MKCYSSKLLPLAAVSLAASSVLVSCTNDEIDDMQPKGSEITFSTKVSRATETNLESLNGFYVYADADGYTNMFIDGALATKDESVTDGSRYILDHNYYWPSGVSAINFWAYGPKIFGEEGDYKVTPEIILNHQRIDNVTVKGDVVNAGKNHKDLVVAYARAEHDEVSGMSVPLNFHHAFTQIEVLAHHGGDATKVVKIKGAWIMNVGSTGNLSFDKSMDKQNYMSWSNPTGLTNYGNLINGGDGLQLSTKSEGVKSTTLIGSLGEGVDHSLMLIPQTKAKYDFTKSSDNGVYIMVLCRIETIHPGTQHVESKADTEGTHKHQLFPANSEINENEYGYACVPVDIAWLPGVRYVYDLEFCGTRSGAGVYPPGNPDPGAGFPDAPDIPEGKEGKPVLDYPITFTVSVDAWKPANEDNKDIDTPMN